MVEHLIEQEFIKVRSIALPELTAPRRWNFFTFLKRVFFAPKESLENLTKWDRNLEEGLKKVDTALAEHLHQSILARAEDLVGELSLADIEQLLISQIHLPPSSETTLFASWFKSCASKRKLYRYICSISLLISITAAVGIWVAYGEVAGASFLALSLGMSFLAFFRGLISERERMIDHLTEYLELGVEGVHASVVGRISQVTKAYLSRIEQALGEHLLGVKQFIKQSGEAFERVEHLKRGSETCLQGIEADRSSRRVDRTRRIV
jgi:hypothetical protein